MRLRSAAAPGALTEARSANRTLREANASLKDDLQGARDDLEAQGRELAQAREETRRLRAAAAAANSEVPHSTLTNSEMPHSEDAPSSTRRSYVDRADLAPDEYPARI